jgi:hypothetical protein
MFIFQEQQPRRFSSDAAFDFQLVRRVLRLAPANAGTYWDHKESRSRKVYRDVPPRVIRTLAVPLKESCSTSTIRQKMPLGWVSRNPSRATSDPWVFNLNTFNEQGRAFSR